MNDNILDVLVNGKGLGAAQLVALFLAGFLIGIMIARRRP